MTDRWHARLCDGFVVAYGGWTLLCHATVFLGGNLLHLLTACAVVTVALLVTRRKSPAPGPDSPAPGPVDAGPRRWPGLVAMAAISLVPAVGYWTTHDLVRLWWSSLPALLFGAGMLLRDRGPVDIEPPTPSGSRVVWALALVMAVLAATSPHFDADDAMYLGFATQTADFPRQSLLAKDAILGLDLPLLLGVYRVHSFEVLGGALAYLTGTSVLVWMHRVFPFVGAMVVVLALAQVAKQWAPRHWPWVTVIGVVYLTMCDSAYMSHGNHAFARLQQGKSLMLSAVFPLALGYALDYARRPGRRRWVLLFLSQVAAVGLSVNALVLLPATILLALLAGLRPERRSWRYLGLGLLTLAYPLALAGYAQVQASGLSPDWTPPTGAAATLAHVAERGLGEPALVGFAFLVMLMAPSAAAGRGTRRALWLLSTAFVLVFFNPYLAEHLIELPGRRGVYPRTIWIVPLPLLVGLLLTAPRAWMRDARRRALSTAGLAIVVFALLPGHARLFHRPGGWFATPRPKVPASLAATERLTELAGPSERVLASPPVSAWLSALRRHPHPLYSREIYHDLLAMRLGEGEAARRRSLALVAAGRVQATAAVADELLASVDADSLSAVCLEEAAQTDVVRQTLRRAGFVVTEGPRPYEFWVRGPSPVR